MMSDKEGQKVKNEENREENDIIKTIEEYSDKKVTETFEDDRLTNVVEQVPNINLEEREETIPMEDIIYLINMLTLPNILELNPYSRPDNIRIEAFIAPMIFLKDFFKKYFKLDFSSFKCQEVLGPGIAQMRKILNLKIYQILCYYPKNKQKILEASKTLKNNNEKSLFYYFMTRTYEELYTRYTSGDINFPLFVGGTVRICSFITLAKEINKKIEKLRNKEWDEQSIEEKMSVFENYSLNMINIIKVGIGERRERREKIFIIESIPEFESRRRTFKEKEDYHEMTLDE